MRAKLLATLIVTTLLANVAPAHSESVQIVRKAPYDAGMMCVQYFTMVGELDGYWTTECYTDSQLEIEVPRNGYLAVDQDNEYPGTPISPHQRYRGPISAGSTVNYTAPANGTLEVVADVEGVNGLNKAVVFHGNDPPTFSFPRSTACIFSQGDLLLVFCDDLPRLKSAPPSFSVASGEQLSIMVRVSDIRQGDAYATGSGAVHVKSITLNFIPS